MAAQAVVLFEGVVVMCDIKFARHDRAHCLAPGLFRSLQRGERKNKKLDVTYSHGQETLRFVGFEPLGADDMRLLQGLVSLSGPHGVILDFQPRTITGRQLRLLLNPKFDAAESDGLVVRETVSRLLSEVGLTDGGENIKALKASLLRMSNVTVLVTSGSRSASFHLMSHALDDQEGRLWVALNPRIASAVLGRLPHARIELSEARKLDTDPARLIHQRLSGWIDPGKSGVAGIETLSRYVWPDPASDATERKRNSKVRAAVAEIGGIWRVSEQSKDVWQFIRPRTIGHKSP